MSATTEKVEAMTRPTKVSKEEGANRRSTAITRIRRRSGRRQAAGRAPTDLRSRFGRSDAHELSSEELESSTEAVATGAGVSSRRCSCEQLKLV